MNRILLTQGRVPRQKVSTLGNLSAAIASDSPSASVAAVFNVVLWDTSNKYAVWPLDGVSANGTEACCCLFGDRLAVSIREYPGFKTKVFEFKLAADPFASKPSLVTALPSYGNADSSGAELVRLPSGEIVSMTYQHTDMKVCALMRDRFGIWDQAGFFTLSDETGTSHFFSMCAVPWSNDLWAFMVKDGGNGVDLGIFYNDNGVLTLKKTYPKVLPSRAGAGEISVNGELPFLVATEDGEQINLSYTNAEWIEIDGVVQQQQAFPVVTGFKADVVPFKVLKGPQVVVSIKNHIPIITLPDSIDMDYNLGNPAVTVVTPTKKILTKDGFYAWGTKRHDLVYVNTAGNVVLDTTDQVIPPEPIPTPDAIIVESPMSDLSWSGADPGNIGTFMLQWSPSETGPWSDLTSHWPIRFQNVSAKHQSGAVLKIGPNYYRLRPV